MIILQHFLPAKMFICILFYFQFSDNFSPSKEEIRDRQTDQGLRRANVGESDRDGERVGEQVDARARQTNDRSLLRQLAGALAFDSELAVKTIQFLVSDTRGTPSRITSSVTTTHFVIKISSKNFFIQ